MKTIALMRGILGNTHALFKNEENNA